MTKKIRKIGAHVSAAGGTHKAIDRVVEIGGNCVQVFSGSPRVWARPDLADIDLDKLFAKQHQLSVSPIFTHALYLVNLASDKPELLQKSRTALQFDLQFDAAVKGSGVVVHLGSHQGRGWEHDRQQVADQIKWLLENTPSASTFLIENSAGQKGKIGSDLAEIKWLLDQIKSPRLGWCFDTCHAWAAGYRLVAESDFSQVPAGQIKSQQPISILEEIEKYSLWSSLRLIHANGSKDACGSGRDRHANFGEGELSSQEIGIFLQHKQVIDIPVVTEVPGFDGKGPDAQNLSLLKELAA